MVFPEKEKLINGCPCKLEQGDNGTGDILVKRRFCRSVKHVIKI